MKTAATDLARERRRAHEPARGPAPRPTSGRRSRSARRPPEAERGREAWTLGQGMKKPVAGCYGRLTRWKGEGCCLHGSAVVSGLRSGSGPDQSSPFLGPSTFLTTSLLFANPSTITASPCSNAASGPASSKASIAARNSGERSLFNGAAALAGIAVAGLLLKHGPNSEVADCHQRIDGVPGRKTRLAEARSCASAVSICGAPGRVPAWMRAPSR